MTRESAGGLAGAGCLLAALVVCLGVAALAGTATYGYLSDTETVETTFEGESPAESPQSHRGNATVSEGDTAGDDDPEAASDDSSEEQEDGDRPGAAGTVDSPDGEGTPSDGSDSPTDTGSDSPDEPTATDDATDGREDTPTEDGSTTAHGGGERQ